MKKSVSSGLISGLCIVLIVGALIGLGRGITLPSKPSTSTSKDVEILSRGITVKKTGELDNIYFEKDQIFEYSIFPESATNQEIEVAASYIDGTDCSNVLDYSLVPNSKNILLSCKAPFSKKINVDLRAKDNEKAKATIVLDYVKKIKTITAKENLAMVFDYDDYTSDTYTRITDFKPSNLYKVVYTEFTKDKSFSFSYSYTGVELIENTANLSSKFTVSLESQFNSLRNVSESYGAPLSVSGLQHHATTDADKAALSAITKEDVDNNTGYLKYLIKFQINGTAIETPVTIFMYGNYSFS